nr:ankyrin repeat protein [Hymenolepis microstoma]
MKVERKNKDVSPKVGNSCLTLAGAVESGDVVALRGLLNAGHSPEKCEWDPRTTPLIHATHKRNLEVMSILLQYGAKVSKKHKDGYTAIHVASVLGFLEGLELLSTYGGDLNEPDKDNLTPLCLAASEGRVDVVHYLFHRVNSIESPCNSSPLTPLVMAVIKNQVGVVEFLLHAQDKSAYQEFDLYQALLQATIQGHEVVVCALLAHNANPNYQNDSPPIHAAIHKGHQNILEILCNNGADIEIRDYQDFTPLMTACFMRNIQAVKYLLNLGADIEASACNRKYTPLKIAIRTKFPKIIQLIERAMKRRSK